MSCPELLKWKMGCKRNKNCYVNKHLSYFWQQKNFPERINNYIFVRCGNVIHTNTQEKEQRINDCVLMSLTCLLCNPIFKQVRMTSDSNKSQKALCSCLFLPSGKAERTKRMASIFLLCPKARLLLNIVRHNTQYHTNHVKNITSKCIQ